MKYKISILLLVVTLAISCKEEKEIQTMWIYQKTIQLADVFPIGIAQEANILWLSDGDNNRLVQINTDGAILKTIDSLDRPMHIDVSSNTLYIPQYGNDRILSYTNGLKETMQMTDSLDAPAGISVVGNQIAIADFYNNRILFKEKDTWLSIGKKGNSAGSFYYPTDVQITDSLIWVADAYNNRIQVFDKKGKFIRMLGEDQNMNAATGVYVSKDEVFVTDFENNRVLIFNKEGDLQQIISDHIHNATDVLKADDTLFVVNYRKGELVVYTKKGVKEKSSKP